MVGVILGLLLKRLQGEIAKREDEAKRQKLDAENLKKYEDAKNRADKIKAATDLLNGSSAP